MDFIQYVIDFILHIDQHMIELVQDYLRKTDIESYRQLIAKLGLRK